MKILFFGQIRERLNTTELSFDEPVKDVLALKLRLAAQGDHWQECLIDNSCLNAVNQTIVADDWPLQLADEVAFFPPVTGG